MISHIFSNKITTDLGKKAHKCRHPVIRRKAVALLYSSPRQEGVWDSILTARVAERLIGIEEAGLGKVTRCEDIPDWARISDVEVSFNRQGRVGTVRYSRPRSPLEKVREYVSSKSIFLLLDQSLSLETCFGSVLLCRHVPRLNNHPLIGITDSEIVIQYRSGVSQVVRTAMV